MAKKTKIYQKSRTYFNTHIFVQIIWETFRMEMSTATAVANTTASDANTNVHH